MTATFYFDPSKKEDNVSLQDIQVILLATSVMYFILGSCLEYIKKADFFIMGAILTFGLLKIIVGVYDILFKQDLEFIYVQNIQLVHLIVIFRLGISTIYVAGLAKWYSRTNLPLIMVSISAVLTRIGDLVY